MSAADKPFTGRAIAVALQVAAKHFAAADTAAPEMLACEYPGQALKISVSLVNESAVRTLAARYDEPVETYGKFVAVRIGFGDARPDRTVAYSHPVLVEFTAEVTR